MQRTIRISAILSIVIFLCSILTILLARQITMFGSWPGIDTSTLFYIVGWYALLFATVLAPQPAIAKRPIGAIALNRWVVLLAISAAAGAVVLTYEFAVVRGYGFLIPVSELRVMQVNAANGGFVGSWLGGLGRLLVSAIVVAWVMVCLQWPKIHWISVLLAILAGAAVFAYQAKFEGGRIFATCTILTALFACFLAYVSQEGFRINVKAAAQFLVPVVLLCVMFVAVTLYSLYVFNARGEYTTAQSTQAVSKSNNLTVLSQPMEKSLSEYGKLYARFASGFEINLTTLQNPAKFDASRYGLAMTWIYLTHGPSEFDRIYKIKDLRHSKGFYQFSQIAQVVSKISGQDHRYDLASNLPNVGTYITLPGASYLDFGTVIGLIFAAILGFVFKAGIVSAIGQPGTALALVAPLVFIIILVSPVTTLIPNFWTCFLWVGLMALTTRWCSTYRSA